MTLNRSRWWYPRRCGVLLFEEITDATFVSMIYGANVSERVFLTLCYSREEESMFFFVKVFVLLFWFWNLEAKKTPFLFLLCWLVFEKLVILEEWFLVAMLLTFLSVILLGALISAWSTMHRMCTMPCLPTSIGTMLRSKALPSKSLANLKPLL